MERVKVLGVGWRREELTLGAMEDLRAGGAEILLKTGRLGCAQWLESQGLPFGTLDALYETCDDFDQLAELSAREVLKRAEKAPVLYCVADLSDSSCPILGQMAPDRVTFVPGVLRGSELLPYAGGEARVLCAADIVSFEPDPRRATLIRELDGPILAGEVKLKLMEAYPEDAQTLVLTPEGAIQSMPLWELDQLKRYDHRLCVLVPAVKDVNRLSRFDVGHLKEIMARLRAEDGCPWDREQTHSSLRRYLLEEAYEAAEAIDRGDMFDLCEELGDVLLQVVFHAEIGRQYGEFDFSDVTTAICEKMLRRHPHVFGDVRAETPEEVDAMWREIKARERASSMKGEKNRDEIQTMPALAWAEKASRKARESGRELPSPESAWKAWREHPGRGELGEALLALAHSAEDPEGALAEAVRLLIRRTAEDQSGPSA